MKELQLLAGIIQKSMGLTEAQVWLYNQRRTIPNTSELFITLHRDAIRPYGNNSRQSGDDVKATQFFQTLVSIQMFSRSLEATTRLPEVLAAIRSPYSLYVQEKEGIKISSVPTSIVDASEVEGASMLYRTRIQIMVLSAYELVAGATYFDPDTIQFSVDETEA